MMACQPPLSATLRWRHSWCLGRCVVCVASVGHGAARHALGVCMYVSLSLSGVHLLYLLANIYMCVCVHGMQVDAVVVGADRVVANGDTANTIGTYSLAILASYHNIPFFIAAPTTTLDPSLPHGGHILIEQRSTEEVTHGGVMEGIQVRQGSL